MDAADKAASFAAVEAIRLGKWDDVLVQLGMEIKFRIGTDEFKERVLDRATFRAAVLCGHRDAVVGCEGCQP